MKEAKALTLLSLPKILVWYQTYWDVLNRFVVLFGFCTFKIWSTLTYKDQKFATRSTLLLLCIIFFLIDVIVIIIYLI